MDNRTIVEMATSLLTQSGMDKALWAEAIATAVYLKNRSLTHCQNNITPYEAFTGKKPNIKHLKIFGSLAMALIKSNRRKITAKGKEYRMVGYS